MTYLRNVSLVIRAPEQALLVATIDPKGTRRKPAVMVVLMAITASDPIAMGIDGALATSANTLGAESGGLAGLLTSSKEIGDAPPAFLNYLFFDAEMNYIPIAIGRGFVQMSNVGREDGSNVPHERLAQEVVAEEAGFFYIYLSNESQTGSEAFFDDFSIQVSESFIVQQIPAAHPGPKTPVFVLRME